MSSPLFQTCFLGRLGLKNRLVRSATWEGMATDDGHCTPDLVRLIRELAQGEVGLIISSHTFVSPEGQAGPRRLSIDDDRFIPGLREMANAAHEGGSKILLQLVHAGVCANSTVTKLDAIGPSSLATPNGPLGRSMTPTEIEQTVAAFVRAAERAQTAGVDGVQIHAAHGYLLSQFLSPYFNKRADEFGGKLENRARIVRAIVERIKAACGNAFPLAVKLNCDDFLDGGLTVDDSVQIAKMVERSGADALEISGGTGVPTGRFTPVRVGEPRPEDQEAYYRDAAKRFKAAIRVPLILVGGIRSFSVAQQLVDEGIADFISMSRPFICEPNLIARWKSGNTARSACTSCNRCFLRAKEGGAIRCDSNS